MATRKSELGTRNSARESRLSVRVPRSHFRVRHGAGRLARLAIGVAALAGCDPTPTAAGGCTPTTTRVCMSGNQFVPLNLVVGPGVEVTWTNGDGTPHTVTNAQGSPEIFNSGTIQEGDSFHWTFDNLGTYRYYCTFHSDGGPAPTGMHGTITVK
jgi:plastocyanin